MLLWILDRCEQKVRAVKTPISYMPDIKGIHLDGVDLEEQALGPCWLWIQSFGKWCGISGGSIENLETSYPKHLPNSYSNWKTGWIDGFYC